MTINKITLFMVTFLLTTICFFSLSSQSYAGIFDMPDRPVHGDCCQLRGSCFDIEEPEPDTVAQLCLGDIKPGVCNEVTGMCEEVNNVPTLSEWGLIAIAGILGIIGFIAIRRKKVTV